MQLSCWGSWCSRTGELLAIFESWMPFVCETRNPLWSDFFGAPNQRFPKEMCGVLIEFGHVHEAFSLALHSGNLT